MTRSHVVALTFASILLVLGSPAFATDRDGDGFHLEDGDCNDADAAIYPDAPELCDGRDNDCDGQLDERLRCPRACADPVPLGPPGVIDVNSSGWVGAHELVWTGSEFGVFYADLFDVLLFRRADALGQPTGAIRGVGAAQVSADDFVWTGSQYGVFWQSTHASLVFERLDREGNLLSFDNTFEIGSGTPAVAWNGSEFALTYRHGSDASLERFDDQGQPISTTAIPGAGQDLVWSGDRYGLLSWSPGGPAYFTPLAANGAPMSAPVLVNASPTFAAQLVWSSGAFSVFLDTRGPANEKLGRLVRLGPDGVLLGAPVPLPGPPLAAAWDGSAYAMARLGPSGHEIVFSRLDAVGVPFGSSLVLPDADLSITSLAWNGAAFGLVWSTLVPDAMEIRLAVIGCACADDDEDTFSSCDDCDDADPRIYPGGPQVCDGVNNDCSDPAWPSTSHIPEGVDNDGDGLDECDGDCDDARATVFPGAVQNCDGVNNDCNDPSWPQVTGEQDVDGDAHPACNDCNDTNPVVFPGAVQACDGLNNDCTDTTWPAVSIAELDQDGDGFRGCHGDCADHDAARNPIAREICNGTDDDCDSLVDEDALGQDTDTDGVFNLCDNCREDANASQADEDADRVGDACDNCPFDRNSAQSDGNDDGEGDVCDWDDRSPYLTFETMLDARWEPEVGFAAFNVYRGDLQVLRSGGDYTQAPGSNALAQRWCGLADTTLHDDEPIAPGARAFYLLTGSPESAGSLGSDSAGTPRPNANPCP